jgi:hypothetical protein
MRNGPSLSQAAVYAELLRVSQREFSEPLEKMLRRRNSSVSRAHRLDSALTPGVTPNAMQLRAAMVQMAFIARTNPVAHLREQAVRIYDECWHLLRKIDLGLPEKAVDPLNGVGDTPNAGVLHGADYVPGR